MQAERSERTVFRIGLSELQSRADALGAMNLAELREEYERVFDETTASRNKRYLVRRIANRMQEQVHGGLSRLAQERIEQLARNAPIRRTLRLLAPALNENREAPPPPQEEPAKAPIEAPHPRRQDPRLPAAGTVIRKTFHEVERCVTVLENGFEMDGKKYASLSGVARAIAGTNWNGFQFFAHELKAAKGEES